jgi:hypothetical protein
MTNNNEGHNEGHNEGMLRAALKAIAAAETTAPPAELEVFLLKRLKRRRIISWPLAFEAIAAAAIIAIAIGTSRAPEPVESGFVPVPFVEPIGPNERTQLVRVNIPVGALAKWGLSVTAANPNRSVDAEVVVGEDGLARAVRFIQ